MKSVKLVFSMKKLRQLKRPKFKYLASILCVLTIIVTIGTMIVGLIGAFIGRPSLFSFLAEDGLYLRMGFASLIAWVLLRILPPP
jgi:hypothetical protein